ncbi:MAG: hypothetical protein ACXV5L_11475 [Thermoanaerobaculia bacterium]
MREHTALIFIAFLTAATVAAQPQPRSARLSFFGSSQRADLGNGDIRDFGELTAALVLRSAIGGDDDAFEYALDLRSTGYQSAQRRPARTRLYEAWGGGRIAGGHVALRAGQMWLSDLGSLGSVGGAMAEYQTGSAAGTGQWRIGAFAGVEPKPFDAGYLSSLKKGGAWVAFDGHGSRRHVIGYVQVRNGNLTERSVLTTMNFIPVSQKLFFYQTAEYDLAGPGGQGRGGLNYIFANARYAPARIVEFMATYHHGRSIDARTISDDILNGRPVDQKTLDGFLFDSVGGRVTVEVMRGVRVFGGYSTDRHNANEKPLGRISAGLWVANIARSGIDLNISDNRTQQPGGDSDAWYASIGRNLGRRLYVSADYSTSLAIVRVVDNGGTTIFTHPQSKRYGVSAVWNLYRSVSLLFTSERFSDDFSTDNRITTGMVYRF